MPRGDLDMLVEMGGEPLRQRVFVGDVQGCSEELGALLDRARDRFGSEFELWVSGDLINRGPSNLKALQQVRELWEVGRARYVLGNHEIGLIETAFELRTPSPYDTHADVLDSAEADDWIEWLCARPLVERGRLGQQDFVMLHASTHPDWTLDEIESRAAAVSARLRGGRDATVALLSHPGDPDWRTLGRLTRGRTVYADGDWSSRPEGPGLEPWHAAWSRRAHSFGVVYGHWARQGLHIAPGLRGLDTGCVHHGRGRDGVLTAWLPDVASDRPFDDDASLWQEPARRAYYAHRDA